MKKAQLSLVCLLTSFGSLGAAEIRVPDQHETIQGAIAAGHAGDTILVAAGIYFERIVLKPGIVVRSAGSQERGKLGLIRAEVTIIDGGKQAGKSPGVAMAEGATLDGFTITNVGEYDEKTWQKHWNEKGENQRHEHIGHFGTPGIAIAGVTCTVTNNIVHHNGDTGIAIRGVEGKRCAPVVANNVSYRNMGGGIGSMEGATSVIDGNICFENFYAGIGHNGADPQVTRNVCYKNIRAGIGISEGASPTVRHNRCYANRRAGIGVRSGPTTCPLIDDNDCFENEMAGIGSEDEAAPIIRGNRCYRNKAAGIGCRNDASSTILENHCYENEAAGIGVSSASANLIRNRIERNRTAGIGISGRSKVSAIDNICSENKLVAVGIPSGGEVLLQGNTLVRTGGMPPIVAILGGSKAVLTDNTIKGGGIAAIMLVGQLEAIGNVIEGQNGGSGILARENSEVTLAKNLISGYKMPIRDQGAKSIINSDLPEEDKKAEK